MKVRHYGALTSAFLISLSGAASAASNVQTYDCPPPKTPVHHTATVVHKVVKTVVRPAPVRTIRRAADAEYTQSNYQASYYDYNSAGSVSEVLARRLEESLPPQQEQPWQVAPNDGDIRFHYNAGASNVGASYYAPPLRAPVAINDQEFSGGVGYGQGGGGGGGAGFVDGYGQVHFANGDGGGMNGNPVSNYGNGGANSGFGPDRNGVWHGYNWQNGQSNGY